MAWLAGKTIDKYAGALRAVAKAGSVKAECQRHAALEHDSSALRTVLAAVQLCSKLELIPFLHLGTARLIAKASRKFDSPQDRCYLDERTLCTMARAVECPRDMAVLAVTIISLCYLLRVGEAATLKPADLEHASLWYTRWKTGYRRFKGKPPPYVCAWARWLRRWAMAGGVGGRNGGTVGDEGARIFSEKELETGIQHLLRNSQQAQFTFHMCRRGGAFVLFSLGKTVPEIADFGFWDSLQTARKYATPDHPMPFVKSWDLPFPPNSGVVCSFAWRRVSTVYPAALFPSQEGFDLGGGGGPSKKRSHSAGQPAVPPVPTSNDPPSTASPVPSPKPAEPAVSSGDGPSFSPPIPADVTGTTSPAIPAKSGAAPVSQVGGTSGIGIAEEQSVCDFLVDPSAPIPESVAAVFGVAPGGGNTELRPDQAVPPTRKARRKARKRGGEGEGDAPPAVKRKVPQDKGGAPARAVRPIGRAGRAVERASFRKASRALWDKHLLRKAELASAAPATAEGEGGGGPVGGE